MVLRYSHGFYPFSGTRPDFYFSGTRPDSTLSWYSPGPFFGTHQDSTFLVLTRTLFRYSPGFHFPSTYPDPSSVLAWISTFSALARILPFQVLARIQPSQYSPGPFFGTRLGFYFSNTCPDSSFSVLPRIPTFRYSPGFHICDTRPDSTLLVLARIPPFRYSPGFHYLFQHCAWITHLPRHRAWVSLSPSVGVTLFR